MGVIQVEIKTLRGDRPVVFSWENPVKKVIQCVLITCPCQSITFPDTRDMPLTPDGMVMFDKDNVCDLAAALEKADLITHASLDNMDSLFKHVVRLENEELNAKEKKVKARKERRIKLQKERRQRKKEERETLENAEDKKKEGNAARLDDEEPLEEGREDIQVNQSVEEQSPSPDNSSVLPDHETFDEKEGSAARLDDEESKLEQPLEEGREDIQVNQSVESPSPSPDNSSALSDHETFDEKEGSTARLDDVQSKLEQPLEEGREDIQVNQSVEEQSPDNSSALSDHDTFDDRQVVTDYVVIASFEEPAPADDLTSDSLNTTNPGQTTEPGTTGSSVDIVALENVGVISATATATSVAPVSEDDTVGLMEAIKSIVSEYPEAKDVARGRKKVQIIRHLTEEERLKMFRFGSDREKENLKKLEEAKAYLCDICGKIVTLKGKGKHMKTHHDGHAERTHVCEICGKAYAGKALLRGHLASHDANRNITCRYCPRSFMTKSGRNKHERRHFAVYSGVCKVCDMDFVDPKAYKRHLHKFHNTEANKETKSSNADKNQKRKRVWRKRQVQKVSCHVCNKLITKNNMKTHMYNHEGKMYTCNICGKVMAFATRYPHKKLHSKESVACRVCGKRVINIDVHMRIHTGEKPYKCRYCDKRFSVPGPRQVHEITHTGERPHKCTICNKSWKDRNCYKIHMQKLHPGNPFTTRDARHK